MHQLIMKCYSLDTKCSSPFLKSVSTIIYNILIVHMKSFPRCYLYLYYMISLFIIYISINIYIYVCLFSKFLVKRVTKDTVWKEMQKFEMISHFLFVGFAKTLLKMRCTFMINRGSVHVYLSKCNDLLAPTKDGRLHDCIK